jgi:hypothetical protein
VAAQVELETYECGWLSFLAFDLVFGGGASRRGDWLNIFFQNFNVFKWNFLQNLIIFSEIWIIFGLNIFLKWTNLQKSKYFYYTHFMNFFESEYSLIWIFLEI